MLIWDQVDNFWKHISFTHLYTKDSPYIMVPYSTIAHTVHWIQSYNFSHTRISQKTPIAHHNRQAMDVSHELLGENRPPCIGSALYQVLTHWGWDKMDAISQTTFSSTFSWMKIFEFRLKYHRSLFLRVQLTIFQHWFRYWLGAAQATSHYLNQ